MDLKEINYLLRIQQHRSITKAAETLFISQPALSKFLKSVETQVGTPLFNRIGNQMVPTFVGRRYLSYAAEIAALQDDWNIERSDLLNEEIGLLSMTIPPLRSSSILPAVMPAFFSRYPQVKVSLTEESSMIKQHWLESSEIDFVICSDVQALPTQNNRLLGKEEIVLVVATDHPLAKGHHSRSKAPYPVIDPKLLGDQSFILNSSDQTTGKLACQLFEKNEITPQVLMRTRNTETAIRLAATGTCLAFAPETYVRNINFDKPPVLFSVGEEKIEINLYARYQSGRYLPAYAIYFLDLVEKYMAGEDLTRQVYAY